MALKGLAMVAAGGASGPGIATKRALGTLPDQLHAEGVPVLAWRVAAVA